MWLSDRAVRDVFAERTGLAGIPQGGVYSIDLKRAHVQKTIDVVRSVRANQKAIKTAATEAVQQKAAERAREAPGE